MTSDGVGLPVRLHDLLLAMAGRVDDDALSQAREFLAVGELDRAVELLVGTLLAGSIPVLPDERAALVWLLGEVRSNPALADRLPVVEVLPRVRHRFTAEADPFEGVGDALSRAVSVLPDVRGVRCVWRSSPAGSTPGPLPQRVVLVDIGPKGFAPATAYRIDSVLRGAGVRAAVEVVTVGTQLSDYHAAAMTSARALSVAAPRADAPVARQPVETPQTTWFDNSDELPAPAPVAEPTPAPEAAENPGSRRSRAAARESLEGAQPFPPKPVKRIAVPAEEEAASPAPAPAPAPAEERPAAPIARAEVTTELKPDELAALQAALAEGAGEPSSVDANLSERERALLQQLHEELAQREQSGTKATDTGRWQIDRSSSRQSAFGAANNGHPPFPPAG
ncbi:hypothetical protein Lesp02_51920 [Lentzea sp. NBRC 105346]|uniref:hypothetical protein n=1 Tax=Lentzea sp. NBRC 105346 TaxID=3032205 RepID=UPI0024A40C67|nr:hypothetical protein [Lentzea sp. NBRC 105346]GLZ33004.1 hypothetical protein Lesp02_51920 [Lentzea sp. NBRC 105346]